MENTANVEYYTTYQKTPEKNGGETPTSGCALAHPSIPSGSRDLQSLPVAMVLVLLCYYYSMKKVWETGKKKYVNKKCMRKKVREKKSTGKKYAKKKKEKKYAKKKVREKKYAKKKSGKTRLRMRTPLWGDFW